MNKQKQDRFLKLYQPIHDRFERFCRARVYGDLEYTDLMNDTLLKAYEKFDTLRSETAFLSFLFSIAVRILANNNRKQQSKLRERGMGTSKDLLNVIDVNANASQNTEVYFLHQALALLPNEQRESLILFEITGFSIKEIAQIQGASETAVKQRLRRGRLRLKELLMDRIVENETK